MTAPRKVLIITVDKWRGDGLSVLGLHVVKTTTPDQLAERGVLFANHLVRAAPYGPSRAGLCTSTSSMVPTCSR